MKLKNLIEEYDIRVKTSAKLIANINTKIGKYRIDADRQKEAKLELFSAELIVRRISGENNKDSELVNYIIEILKKYFSFYRTKYILIICNEISSNLQLLANSINFKMKNYDCETGETDRNEIVIILTEKDRPEVDFKKLFS